MIYVLTGLIQYGKTLINENVKDIVNSYLIS